MLQSAFLNISVKFHQNISFQHTERTRMHGRNGNVLCSNGSTSKSRQTRVTIHMFWTLPCGVLYFCEVSLKYFDWYQSYGADTHDKGADGLTVDGQKFQITEEITKSVGGGT